MAKFSVKFCFLSVFLMFCGFVFCENTFTGKKGLYCQDPDTGLFYPPNATWHSVSFCGNYTCKIRQKNPHTNTLLSTKLATNVENHIKNDKINRNVTGSEILEKIFNLTKTEVNKECKQNECKDKEDDRLLNEDEIRSITRLLYSVKKSDLNTLVEIYKLANDIFNEIDVTATTEAPKYLYPNPRIQTVPIYQETRPNSYWYDPKTYYIQYPKDAVIAKQQGAFGHPKTQILNSYNGATAKTYAPDVINKENPAARFGGPNGYYYPFSTFQSMSSYLQNLNSRGSPPYSNNIANSIPVDIQENNALGITGYDFKRHAVNNEPRNIIQNVVKIQKNETSRIFNANRNEWPSYSYFNVSTFEEKPKLMASAFVVNSVRNEGFIDPVKNTVIVPNNPFAMSETATATVEEANQPEKIDLLETIRKGHGYQRSPDFRPRPVKKIRFEKIGKVIRLDELKRARRSTPDSDMQYEENNLETFLSKIECELDTEVGVFRHGDSNKVYPHCCPERITDDGDR